MSLPRGILWSQLRIGVAVSFFVVVAAVSIFFIDEVGDLFETRYTLQFRTFTTQTLRPRAPVWLAGQPVGHVKSLELQPPARGAPARLRVALSLSTEARPFIQGGSVAQVITSGLLGEAVVNILPAARPAEPLPDGGELPTAPQLDPFDVTRRLQAVTDSFFPVLELWSKVLDLALNGSGTLPKLARDPEEIVELRGHLNELAAAFDTVGHAAGGLGRLLSDDEVRAALGRMGPRLSRLAAGWAAKEGTLGRLAGDPAVLAHLEGIVASLSQISERLQTSRGTLGRVLNDQALAMELAKTRRMLRELKAELGARAGGRRPNP